MATQQVSRTRPGGRSMARTRKSAYERLAEANLEKLRAENEAAALKSQIRKQERDRDTRRKVLSGGMSFSHSRIDPVYREQHADFIHRVAPTLKSERDQAEAYELEKYVRAGCPVVDIDKRIEEILQAKAAAPSVTVSPPTTTPPPPPNNKTRNPSPQG
jgi:hypothetical protein